MGQPELRHFWGHAFMIYVSDDPDDEKGAILAVVPWYFCRKYALFVAKLSKAAFFYAQILEYAVMNVNF